MEGEEGSDNSWRDKKGFSFKKFEREMQAALTRRTDEPGPIDSLIPTNPPKETEGKLSRLSMRFHDFVNTAAALLYKQVRKLDYSTPREEAIKNMDALARQIPDWARFSRGEADKRQLGTKKRLQTLGRYYVPPEEIGQVAPRSLEALAGKYDWQGLIPRDGETLQDFIYRGNATLFLHRAFREHKLGPEVKFDTKNWDVSLGVNKSGEVKLIRREDIEGANKRIPFHMDLSWIAGFIEDKSPILSMAYGVCFTLPKYNGFNFLLMRGRYKSREMFMKILAHEMTHMGTVYLDTRREFLETKSYAVGSAAFGEHTVAINKRPNLAFRILKAGIESVFFVSIPEVLVKALPKVQSAISIAGNRRLYHKVGDKLHRLYGEERGNYFLGRLTADEIEEFGYTNDIPARIEQKDSLKWKIMKRNVERV
jgi:hypothetical protein